MAKYINKDALVAEIKRLISIANSQYDLVGNEDIRNRILWSQQASVCSQILSFLDTLEVKEVDLIIHTIIAECCDWLTKNTNLSHDKIEGCRNLMLTVKEEQFKTQKGK